MNRRNVVKDILWVLATAGLVAAVMRFARGLGPSTALTDSTPWGLWIAFDVLGGVALAAGGFVVAAGVYIFHLEKYRSILRPAILTAFLGYGAVILGLICDLGLPWHIWEPIFHWQHHSVLFEVAWCVMLYFTVLALEFSPVILEHPRFQRPLFQRITQTIKRFTLPLVIAGIILSTLHQSSLGSLFLIMPLRLHPLWYSPLIPLLFFVSAVGLGLMMVTLESFVSSYLYRHPLKMDLLAGLGRAASVVLWIYLAFRLGDLAFRGMLPEALSGSWQSILFLTEILISALIPAILLSIRSVRTNPLGLGTGAVLTVLGMVLNRLSVGMIAMEQTSGTPYLPSWIEVAISLGIVAGAGLVFLFFTEHLAVFGEEGPEREVPNPYARPVFDPSTQVYFDPSLRGTVARRSLIFVGVVALTAAGLPSRVVTGQQAPDTPVQAALGWNPLKIDGNRAREAVLFPHVEHQRRLLQAVAHLSATDTEAVRETCRQCHHLSKPNDGPTSCWECHQDMYRPTSIFDHDFHEEELGGNASCGECHQDESGHPARHSRETAIACVHCHENMVPAEGVSATAFNYIAASYKDAMHGQCIGCHRKAARRLNRPKLALCPTCHQDIGTDLQAESDQSTTLVRDTLSHGARGGLGDGAKEVKYGQGNQACERAPYGADRGGSTGIFGFLTAVPGRSRPPNPQRRGGASGEGDPLGAGSGPHPVGTDAVPGNRFSLLL